MDSFKTTRLLTFTLAFLAVFAANAGNLKVYKHVDKKGIIHYSSKKPAGKSYKLLNIRCPECSAWRSSVNWNTTPLIKDKFTKEIYVAAKKHGIGEHILRAVIHAESAFKHQAVSSAGAQGLMQLMPLTQKTYQVSNPFDPEQNINGGAAYLKHLKSYIRDCIYIQPLISDSCVLLLLLNQEEQEPFVGLVSKRTGRDIQKKSVSINLLDFEWSFI